MKAADRRARLEGARLYLVCDGRHPDLEGFLADVLVAGVDIVQLRDKAADDGEILERARTFRSSADRHSALFVVNDRVDLALAAQADGVHLGQEDLPVASARRMAGDGLLIGLSTHSVAQLDDAPGEADYLCAGPVWETPTKPGRAAAGLEVVSHAARTITRPWFAIGGIHPGTLEEVVSAGARRVVVVRAVTEAANPVGAVADLVAGLSGTRAL